MKYFDDKLNTAILSLLESDKLILYHGSNSPEMIGPLRFNERDSGWFGNGFYLTAYPEYAKRWGRYIHKMSVPNGKFAHIRCSDGYENIEYLGDTKIAHQLAGGTTGWIENESLWSKNFTKALQQMGYIGIRVDMDRYPDVEVIVFDPSIVNT